MKIVVTALGTTGDVYPLLALTDLLIKNGHQVRFCAARIYRDKFVHINASFCEVSGPPFDFVEFGKRTNTLISMRNPISAAILTVKETVLRHGAKRYQECLSLMKGYDLVICNAADIPGQEAAIRNELPWITVTYCPGLIKADDNPVYPFLNCSPALRPILWKVIEYFTRFITDPLFNQFIISVGGKARTSVTIDGRFSPHLNLIAASPTLCPPPNFVPNHKYTGAWYFTDPNYIPPPELVDFLASGAPPVVISFGSMVGTNECRTTEILINAVRMTGQRAIIQTKWRALETQNTLPDIYYAEYVPHHWLFPKAHCVVHHGGAGTTTSACWAGVPSVVVPFHSEQRYWGKSLFNLGVAPKNLNRRNLTAKLLAKRINQVLATPAMTKRAQKLGKQIKLESETGLTTAIHLIQSFEDLHQVHLNQYLLEK